MTKEHFQAILEELIDENPLACRGILRISGVSYDEETLTLAVTLEKTPQLKVNLCFLSRHCQTEAEVKAVILHEFLHVLLGHTERFQYMTPALNLALDAVINAIIHRTLGPSYSSMMSRYYAESEGLSGLLRPMNEKEVVLCWHKQGETIWKAWDELYEGKLVVDDILELARMLEEKDSECTTGPGRHFLGNHDPRNWLKGRLPAELEKVLKETLQSMNGSGVWRYPMKRGVGANACPVVFTAKSDKRLLWEQTAWRALQVCLLPDRHALPGESEELLSRLPVLNEGDRRGFLRSIWNPLFPEVCWKTSRKKLGKSAYVYLDVSGSMHAEMAEIIGLLSRLRRYIRMPFWAFSDEVAPATIGDGQLKTSGSGGTSINCVFRHIARTRPERALIITDGYVENPDCRLLREVKGQKLFALVSRDGSAAQLKRAGIPYLQLERFSS